MGHEDLLKTCGTEEEIGWTAWARVPTLLKLVSEIFGLSDIHGHIPLPSLRG